MGKIRDGRAGWVRGKSPAACEIWPWTVNTCKMKTNDHANVDNAQLMRILINHEIMQLSNASEQDRVLHQYQRLIATQFRRGLYKQQEFLELVRYVIYLRLLTRTGYKPFTTWTPV